MERRRFIKLCGTTAALAGLQFRYLDMVRAGEAKSFNKVKLVDGQGNPLKAKDLSTKEAYIFNYPFKSTPCFLINLPAKAAGGATLPAADGDYTWGGGVGPGGTVVAYCAICAHQLTFPNKDHAPINYYGPESSSKAAGGRGGVIVCCEHDRLYDPGDGGRMIATDKKATPPLAAIILEYDAASDEIFATGVVGENQFDSFFKSYKRELAAEYGPGVAKEPIADTSAALLVSQFTKVVDKC